MQWNEICLDVDLLNFKNNLCDPCLNHIQIWQLDHKEDWEPKNWCFQTVVLEKTPERPLDCKIKPVNPKGNQPWISFGRTDAQVEATILWTPDVKSRLIGKDPDVGKDRRQKGMTEDEMVGWRHRLDGHEFEQTLGDSEGQGSLVSQRVRHHWATEQQKQISDSLLFQLWKFENNQKPNHLIWCWVNAKRQKSFPLT